MRVTGSSPVPRTMNNEIYDVVIVGGSVAGLTAGIYCGRKMLKTIILTQKVGGQNLLTNDVENYPGFMTITGPELTEKMRKQVENVKVEIKEGASVVSVSKKPDGTFGVMLESGEEIATKTIIIATGKNLRRLNIPGEKEFEGKGLSFCSICDAPLFTGKDVVVVGGGNSGLESALDLTHYANKIYVLEYQSRFKGDELLQERLKATGKVELISSAKIKEIKGDKFIEKVVYDDAAGTEKEIAVQGVFVHIGWVPASALAKDLVNFDDFGQVVIDGECKTSTPGIFAAGDITNTKYKQYTVAVGEGAKAALSAYDYLNAINSGS